MQSVQRILNPITGFVLSFVICTSLRAFEKADMKRVSVERDLISLHYDHAPDKDDGQSAAADRTILESLFGIDWIREHVLAVSGAYGKNAKTFNSKSDAVMDAAWNDCGGWLAGHTNRDEVVAELARRWGNVLKKDADVWVKEGGQSDITADAVKAIRRKHPDLDTRRIHVVQHSNWNEEQTTDAALAYTKEHTHYIKIKDANTYLNIKGGNDAFEEAARQHPVFGPVWKAAFSYYDPKERLDFSDTGELMKILGLGEIGIDDFRMRFLLPNGAHSILSLSSATLAQRICVVIALMPRGGVESHWPGSAGETRIACQGLSSRQLDCFEGKLNGKTINATFSARPRAGGICFIYNWKFLVPEEEPLQGTAVGGRDPKTGEFVEYAFISNGSHFISRYPGEASDSGVSYGERTGVIDGKDYKAKIKVDRKDRDMFLYTVTSAEGEDENLIFRRVKKDDTKKKKTKNVKSSKE